MAKLKPRTKDKTALIAMKMHPRTRQALSIAEIISALTLHLERTSDSYRLRYEGDAEYPQVQLETFHETEAGKKFRVMTEYDEFLPFVDLVCLVNMTNAR